MIAARIVAIGGMVGCVIALGCGKSGTSLPDAGGVSQATDAGDAFAAPRLSPSALSSFPSVRGVPTGAGVAAEAWLSAHGVTKERALASLSAGGDAREVAKATVEADGCHALRVGAPPEDALLCEIGYAVVARTRWYERARILVVRSEALAKVLDLTTAYVQWDDNSRYVDVALTLTADGQSIEVGDRGPAGSRIPLDVYGDHFAVLWRCGDALATARSSLAEFAGGKGTSNAKGAEYAKEDLREITRICDAHGSWSWRGGRFAHSGS